MLAGAIILAHEFIDNRRAWDKRMWDGIYTHWSFFKKYYSLVEDDKQRMYKILVQEQLSRIEQLRGIGIIK
jgi:hypothetical protein